MRQHSLFGARLPQALIDPLLARLAALLSRAVSSLVSTDPDSAERLARLDGAVIAIQLRDSSWQAFAVPRDRGVELKRQHDGAVAVRVSARFADFIAYARASRRGDSLGAGRIEISGDLAVAQQVQALLAELSIDWEEVLARMVGDIPAHQCGRLARAVATWGRDTLAKFERDTADYLHYDSRLVVERRAIEELGRAVFVLADDVARFEARLRRLAARGRA